MGFDVISYVLSKKYVDDTVIGMGAIKGSNCSIASIVDNLDGTHDITFSWKDNTDVTHTSVLTVKDGETPAFSSVVITGGHRLTFTTQDPTQSVSFDVMDGAKGDTGISVVASNVDENNNLTLTLSNGNVINAGKIKAVTTVDNTLSTTSSNPVENKVITNALNNKVDKEMGKGLFSNEEKTKLANIEDGAQVNVLEKLIINGQEATITDKSIALTLITSAVSNLQNYYLKTETYTKQEVEDLIGQTVGVTIEIVEQLPAVGQTNVIYFVPTSTEGVYSQYIYSNNNWILIGSTTVDLSNYYTKTQVDTLLNGKQNVLTIDSFPTALSNNPVASGGVYTAIAQMQPQFQFASMPTASSSNLGFVYQYMGTTGTYTQNMFYRCVYDSELGEYRWEEVIFHATVTVDSALSGVSTNPVQNKVVKEALDTKQDIMQYSTMPSAQDNLGKIVQYIGTNTANYTNGYFYKAIYDSVNDVYLWTVVKFSADMLVDNALSTTSENPVQNKIITGVINGIQDVIPSGASSTNQLVDRDSLGTASQKNFTPYVSPDNTDVPIASSVYSAITSAVYGAYHPSGSKTIAELTSDLLVFANIGNVYKITEDGLTTELFIGGAGQTIHTGDNAVVVYGGQPNTFLFDLQSGSIDLTPYQTKALASAVEGETTVEGALGALSTNKQPKTLSTSVESQTTVEGALGALSTNKATQAEVNDMNNVLGAKNLLPFDLAKVKSLNTAGTWSGNTYTRNGATFTPTFDNDGNLLYVEVNTASSASSNTYFWLTDYEPKNNVIGKILNGCHGGTWETFWQSVYYVDNSNNYVGESGQYNDDFTIIDKDGATKIRLAIFVRNGVTVSNIKFYPMIRPVSITDDTYVPYAKTNQQLTVENETLTNQVKDMNNVYGSKNLLPIDYPSSTTNGITFTVNDDGSITANGTATANAVFPIVNKSANSSASWESLKNIISGKAVILSGCPSGGSASTYSLRKWGQSSSGTYADYGNGVEFTPTESSLTDYYWDIEITIYNGQTVDNLTFKPMLRLASIEDDTYEPYAKTNQQLTEDKAEQAEVNDMVNVLGAKNLLPYPYDTTTVTKSNVSFTDNGDGTITISTLGNRSSNTFFDLSTKVNFGASNWSLSGSSEKEKTIGSFIVSNGFDNFVSGLDFGYTASNMQTWLVVRSSAQLNNVTIKPMIRLASDSDNTYVPYAPTNAKLNKEKVSWKDNGILGAKNLLPNNATSQTINGITFTVNSDGSVTANGTATTNANASFVINHSTVKLKKGTYIFTALTTQGSESTFDAWTSNWGDEAIYLDRGDGVEFTISSDQSTGYVAIRIYAGQTVSNLTFKPMIRLASDPDTTYQPYAPTNKTLQESKMSYADNGIVGAKNLFNNTATTQTVNGITFTVNSDKSVTVSGTSTATFTFPLGYSPIGQYRLTGCPSGGTSTTYALYVSNQYLYETGNGLNVNFTDNRLIQIYISSGQTFSTPITFYPMIRLVTDTDDTYQLYAMTNQQITPYIQAISNPNLLDNPWFTVNQRGKSSYNAATGTTPLTVDRWHKYGGVVNVVGGGVELSTSDSSVDGNFYSEYLTSETEFKQLFGKTVTLSIKIGDNVYSATHTMPSAHTSAWQTVTTITCPNGVRAILVLSPSTNGRLQVAIHAPKDGNVYTVRAIKLELGSVSTLAMDTAPNYATELQKCRRYYEKNSWVSWIPCKAITNGSMMYGFTYRFDVEKRGNYTITFADSTIGNRNGFLYDLTSNTTIPNAEIVISNSGSYNLRMVQLKITHASIVAGHEYRYAVGDGVFEISADL